MPCFRNCLIAKPWCPGALVADELIRLTVGGLVKVAFVAPFFGVRAAGGAETLCRETAIRLASSGIDVEILTTCVQDLHHDWNADHYSPGTTSEDGLTVHRFRTNRVNLAPFGILNGRLLNGDTLSAEEEKQFMAMHVNSFDLYRFLAKQRDSYDWVCFIPYLFGTTFHGSRLCPGKFVMIPCLHDEAYAHMSIMKDLFQRVDKLVFNTEAEMKLAARLYGAVAGKGTVIGMGMETDFSSDGERFRKRYNIAGPFILYAGRKHETKNVHTLIRDFAAYKGRGDRPDLKLILIGPGSLPVPPGAGDSILDLGFLPEQDKKDAYSAATVFCQPSLNESFSIVMMESWVCGVPCLVHGRCDVTREHVVKSGGGLYYTSSAEFGKCLDYLLADPARARGMGEAGRRYVRTRFDWEPIIRRYKQDVFA